MIYLAGVNERIESKFKPVRSLEFVREKCVVDNVVEITVYDTLQALESSQT